MSYTVFHDISEYQGNYNMNDGCPVVAIKMSGGDSGLYMDPKAATNYTNAAKAGKVIIGYHFAGGTDPTTEANYFIEAMSPFADGDIYALDWEVDNPDPVGWCTTFANVVKSKTGCWPIIYMDASRASAYAWSPLLANCALWVADYAVSPDANVPISYPYIIQQYTDTPLDTDALFIPVNTLKEYGYKAPVSAPAPVPQVPPTQMVTTVVSVPPTGTTTTSTPQPQPPENKQPTPPIQASNGGKQTSSNKPPQIKKSSQSGLWATLVKILEFWRWFK